MTNKILRFKVGDYVAFDIDNMDPAYSPWLFTGIHVVVETGMAENGDNIYWIKGADLTVIIANEKELIPAEVK